MAEVLKFTGNTRHDIDPDEVLEGAKGQLTSVVLIFFKLTGRNTWEELSAYLFG